MQTFLARHAAEIKGVLSGFDRVRFRGTIRWLASYRGLMSFLGTIRQPLTGFKDWAMGLTNQIKEATRELAERSGRRLVHLPSSATSKEQVALDIAGADGLREGLIAVLSCTELCRTFTVGPNRALQKLELRPQPGKCLHYYFYWQHPLYGLMHLRLQTWLPFTIHVCLNGREWLARQMTRAGIGFEQRDNCFTDVADVFRAQRLLDRQLRTHWDQLLGGLVRQAHPAHRRLFGSQTLDYYWSAEETEWATDVMFHSPERLARLYPRLVHHAMTTFGSADVLRFLGRCPHVRQYPAAEIVTSLKTRPEGVRVKHWLNQNGLKMYDKALGSLLRVETTVNNPRDMKAYRATEGEPDGQKSWQRLRKGVADLHRRTEISQQCNERYLDALAAVDTPTPLQDIVGNVCEPVHWQGRRVRALAPLGTADGALLAAVARGEFAINGFRNRDLRPLLCDQTSSDPVVAKRQAARITRQLRLLRAHRLIQKVPQTHRYQLTKQGRITIIALLVAKQTPVEQLAQLAA